MENRTLTGASRCAFFTNRNEIARYYAPIRMIAEALASGQHYTLEQLRELAGTSCARKSIYLLREEGMNIKCKRIPHKGNIKEYWLETEVCNDKNDD